MTPDECAFCGGPKEYPQMGACFACWYEHQISHSTLTREMQKEMLRPVAVAECDPHLDRLFFRLWVIIALLTGVMLVAAARWLWRVVTK